MGLLEMSLLIPAFLLMDLFFDFNPKAIINEINFRFYIVIPLSIGLFIFNSFYFKKKLTGNYLQNLNLRYNKQRYVFSIWWIFFIPIFCVFILPVIYGVLTDTLRFPFLEK
jgi:hypothetical protein